MSISWCRFKSHKQSRFDCRRNTLQQIHKQQHLMLTRPRTSRMSFHSVSFLQPSLHCLRKQRSLRLSSNKVCFRCWDSCTSRVLSWPHCFCCSRAWRPKLCTWKSRRSRAFWCSSCSYDVKDISVDFKKDPQPKVKQVIAFFFS